MSDNPSEGWYQDLSVAGGERYWDGFQWTENRRRSPNVHTPQAPIVVPRNAHPGLVALVLSVVVAPVGLVLGIVSLVRARRSAERRPILGFLATIIGGTGTLGLTILIVGIVLTAGFIEDSQRATAMCQRAAADPNLRSDLLAFVQPLNDVTAPYVPGHGPSDEAKRVIADQIPPLTERISAIFKSTGKGYVAAWMSGTDTEEFLNNTATALVTGTSTTGGLRGDEGSELEGLVTKYSNDLAKQCSGQ